jgi:hypothetical protein
LTLVLTTPRQHLKFSLPRHPKDIRFAAVDGWSCKIPYTIPIHTHLLQRHDKNHGSIPSPQSIQIAYDYQQICSREGRSLDAGIQLSSFLSSGRAVRIILALECPAVVQTKVTESYERAAPLRINILLNRPSEACNTLAAYRTTTELHPCPLVRCRPDELVLKLGERQSRKRANQSADVKNARDKKTIIRSICVMSSWGEEPIITG